MTLEHHPYGEYIPPKATSMIIGSFPIGKFTNPKRHHEIKPHEFHFFFGGEKNLLWKLISAARQKDIHGTQDIQDMLTEMKTGVGDVIKSCRRKNGGASDSDLHDIHFNTELLQTIRKHRIQTVYFTSRKVESWFNRLFPETHDLKKISLFSPSAQSLRALGSNSEFKKWKLQHPHQPGIDFLYLHYKAVFSATA